MKEFLTNLACFLISIPSIIMGCGSLYYLVTDVRFPGDPPSGTSFIGILPLKILGIAVIWFWFWVGYTFIFFASPLSKKRDWVPRMRFWLNDLSERVPEKIRNPLRKVILKLFPYKGSFN